MDFDAVGDGQHALGQVHDSNHHLDSLDHEMLAEAQHDYGDTKHNSEDSAKMEDAALNESLAWIAHAGQVDSAIDRADLAVKPHGVSGY